MTTSPGQHESEICDDPCTRCGGDGMVWVGKKKLAYCGQCGGTGKQPDYLKGLPKCRQPRL